MDDVIEALGAGENETAVNFMKQGKLLLENGKKLKPFVENVIFLVEMTLHLQRIEILSMI